MEKENGIYSFAYENDWQMNEWMKDWTEYVRVLFFY